MGIPEVHLAFVKKIPFCSKRNFFRISYRNVVMCSLSKHNKKFLGFRHYKFCLLDRAQKGCYPILFIYVFQEKDVLSITMKFGGLFLTGHNHKSNTKIRIP